MSGTPKLTESGRSEAIAVAAATAARESGPEIAQHQGPRPSGGLRSGALNEQRAAHLELANLTGSLVKGLRARSAAAQADAA